MTQNSQEFISMNQNQFYCIKIRLKIFIFLPQRIHHLHIPSIQKRIFKSKLSGKDKESPLKLTAVSPKKNLKLILIKIYLFFVAQISRIYFQMMNVNLNLA